MINQLNFKNVYHTDSKANFIQYHINKNKQKISDIVGTHSELNAVIKLGEEDCSKLTLVNTRINRNNLLDHSAPCNGCSDMINQLNFKNVYFSNIKGAFDKLNLTQTKI
jgi:deoxycytidylate deaminase